jgi:signal transduction histidine kinase
MDPHPADTSLPGTVLNRIGRRLLFTVGVNTVVALFLALPGRDSLWVNWVYSQCIGLLIWACIDGGRFVFHPRGQLTGWRMALLVMAGVVAGYSAGCLLANALLGRPVLLGLHGLPTSTLQIMAVSLLAAGITTYVFTSREQLAMAREASEAAERQATEARLRLLESQLEPHMLFNTLANLRALIATDPPRALAMLDRLDGFLRATLQASRSGPGHHTLAAEFERLTDYLALMAVRMGPRLTHTLELPEALRDQPVPALLLQPLVENAIRHGLEPSVAGGHVTVSAREVDGALQLEVQDNGMGCASEPGEGSGFGLAQVRERLASAHGAAAHCHWYSRPGEGTRITLRLPLSTAHATTTPSA